MDDINQKEKKSIFHFSKKQTLKGAIALYFIFLLIAGILGFTIGALYGGINREEYLKNLYLIIFSTNYIYVSIIYFIVFFKKNLDSIIDILLGVFAALISGFYGVIAGLLFFAYLTTRENEKDKIVNPKFKLLIIRNILVRYLLVITILILSFIVTRIYN